MKTNVIYSWNIYSKVENPNIFELRCPQRIKKVLNTWDSVICYGKGRSYGDCALSKNIIKTEPYNYLLDFDEKTGLLHCQSGISLEEIIKIFLPRGWFLYVTPGTKFITVGGAIASDVHGKNHHIDGSFCDFVEEIELLLPTGDIKHLKKGDLLFKATCGGMGLTGIILSAKFKLRKVPSPLILQKIIKTRNLAETLEAFNNFKHVKYSVAWIDSTASGKSVGRAILYIGDFYRGEVTPQKTYYQHKKNLSIPFFLPRWILNNISIKIFNSLYYHIKEDQTDKIVDIDTFFYPLDSISNWNRFYGKRGFLQYQFIIPKERGGEGLEEIFYFLEKNKKGSFLSVLKLLGKPNNNLLSFPQEGYTLALDFKIERGIFEMLNQLDKIVLKYGGRLYLAKDCRMPREVFEAGYHQVDQFRKIRKEYELEKFQSFQSKRLCL